ncbi:MAG: sugar transferase, partial [Devosia sp.]
SCSIIHLSDAPNWDFDRVLIDVPSHHTPEWSGILIKCYARKLEVVPYASFLERRRGQVDVRHFDVTDVSWRPSQLLYARAKRWLDVAGVIISLPLTVPVALATWAYVRIRVGNNSIFAQQRGGYGGQPFTILKFRTMDAEGVVVPGLSMVRRFRLDELPQLLNILRGEMSWIGPRPATVEIARAAEEVDPRYASRLLMRPGLTGWAQVNMGYARTTDEELTKLGFDLYYVKRFSLDLDALILIRTVWVLLFGHARGGW